MLGKWEWAFEKTMESVDQAKALCKISTYRSSDIWDFADEAQRLDPDGVFGFLLVYKGGYEKLHK